MMFKSLFITIVLLGLCSFTMSAHLSQSQEFELFFSIFKDWTSKFNKQFGLEEMAIRFTNWRSNYEKVQEINSKGLEYQLELNDFAAMSPEEFSALHLGLNPELKSTMNESLLGSGENLYGDEEDNSTTLGSVEDPDANLTLEQILPKLPRSVDWRKKGAVTYVRNQGSCGGCWSFSAAGALEGIYAIRKKKLVPLSVQQMLDCSSAYGNNGCDGGLMVNAYQYTHKHGVQGEKSYEYTASVDNCRQNSRKTVFRNKGYVEVPANNYKALKAAVAKQPVSVGIEASSLTVQLYKSGTISTGCSTNLDHAVLIVGYGSNKNGQNHWIVKNSWGPTWGFKGYFQIAMGSQNGGAGVCGINMLASYPTV